MPVTVVQGTFTQGATGATTSIALSAAPKLLMVAWTGKTGAAGIVDGINFGFGYSSGVPVFGDAKSWCLGAIASDGSTTKRTTFMNSPIRIYNISGTELARARVTAWSSSGIDLEWLVSDGTARRFYYWVLCGNELEAVVGLGRKPDEVGEFGIDSQFPVYQDLALPFPPDAMIFGAMRAVTETWQIDDLAFSMGFAARSILPAGPELLQHGAGVANLGAHSGNTVSWTANTIASDDFVLNIPHEGSGGHRIVMAVDELNQDGARLAWYGSDPFASYYGYVALRGASFGIGRLEQPNGGATPVAQSLTGLGFRPVGALFMPIHYDGSYSSAIPTFSDPTEKGLFSLGATDGTNNWSIALSDEDGVATGDNGTRDSATRCCTILLETGVITNIDVDFSITSLDAAGLTIGWQTIDTTIRQVAVFLVGNPLPPVLEFGGEVLGDEREGVNDYSPPAFTDGALLVPRAVPPAAPANMAVLDFGHDVHGDEREGVEDGGGSIELPHGVVTIGALTQRLAQADPLHRVESTAYELYELYAGTGGNEPNLNGTPIATSATLPFNSGVLSFPETYKLVVVKRNRYGLKSRNVTSFTLELDAGGAVVATRPSTPEYEGLAVAAGGAFRVTAQYAYAADGANAADTFLVYLKTGGADPDPTMDTPVEVSMVKRDGVAHLDYTSGTNAHGTVGKLIVRTRRQGSPDVDSSNLNIIGPVSADATGPAAPTGGAFFGSVAEQGQ